MEEIPTEKGEEAVEETMEQEKSRKGKGEAEVGGAEEQRFGL